MMYANIQYQKILESKPNGVLDYTLGHTLTNIYRIFFSLFIYINRVLADISEK